MKKIRTFINNSNLSRFRFYFQIAAFILFIYGGYFSITISEKLPVFACPFNKISGGTCYLLPLQHQLHITLSRFASSRGLHLLKGFLIFAGLSLIFSKGWCGYICPLGTIQDWITKTRRYLHIRFSIYDKTVFDHLKKIKYILLFLLILIPIGVKNSFVGLPELPHDIFPPFCKICPGRILLPLFSGNTSQIYIDFSTKTAMFITASGIIVAGIFITGAFVKKRFFCLFCPMAVLLFIFSKVAFFRLNKDGAKCTRCGNCYRVCDVGIREIADDITNKNMVKEDCIMCFKCVEACPERRCLTVSFLSIPLFTSTETGFFKRYIPEGYSPPDNRSME